MIEGVVVDLAPRGRGRWNLLAEEEGLSSKPRKYDSEGGKCWEDQTEASTKEQTDCQAII